MTEADAWNIAKLDGHAQAALIREGDIPPGGLVEATIDRIQRLDPALNSISHCAFDTARAGARAVDLTAKLEIALARADHWQPAATARSEYGA